MRPQLVQAPIAWLQSRSTYQGLKLPIGLQLYTVRQLLAKDFDGTLHKVKAAGYTEVEAAGYYDRTAADFRTAMDKAGLRCISTHHALDVLLAQARRVDRVRAYAGRGLHRLLFGLDASRPGCEGSADHGRLALLRGEFNRIGEKVKAAGMTFGVHNHDARV